MKNLICALLIFIIPFSAFSQCCEMDDRVAPGLSFTSALSICYLESEGECYTMRPSVDQAPFPGCADASLDNPHWYIIFPASDIVEIEWMTSNCQVSNEGVQFAVYQLKPSAKYIECENLNESHLNLLSVNCDDALFEGSYQINNAKDNIYYILVDGFNSDECDYFIDVTQGFLGNGPADSLVISGPQGLPQGYTAQYSAELFQFKCFESYGCECGTCDLDTFILNWTGPPGSIVTPIPNTLAVDLTMGYESGELCLDLQIDCSSISACIYIEFIEPEFFIKCPDEPIEFRGLDYFYPGEYYADEGNYVYHVIIEDYPELNIHRVFDVCQDETVYDCFSNPTNYPDVMDDCFIFENDTCKTYTYEINWHNIYSSVVFDTICQGDSVEYCGNIFFESGQATCDFLSIYGCDSTIDYFLTVLPIDTSYLDTAICDQDFIEYMGEVYVGEGPHAIITNNGSPCLSVTMLEVEYFMTDTTVVDTGICDQDFIIYMGQTYTGPGPHVIVGAGGSPCPSLAILEVEYFTTDTVYLTDTLCDGQAYDFCNLMISDPGQYACTFSTDGPCDSVVVLTLVEGCSSSTYFYCPNESLVVGATILDSEGTYYIQKDLSNGCYCTDTFILNYSTLGNTNIVQSKELLCDDATATLTVDVDENIDYTIFNFEWLDADFNPLADTEELPINSLGQYGVVLQYENEALNVCQQTLLHDASGEELFEPSITWVQRELNICNDDRRSYRLEFETDAIQTSVVLLNSDQQWIDQQEIDIELPADKSTYSFYVSLENESGSCMEEFTFDVNRVNLNMNWPDTIVRLENNPITLQNPIFQLAGEVEDVLFSPLNGIEVGEDQLIQVDASIGGHVSISFYYESCWFEFQTFILSESVNMEVDDLSQSIYVPNAFSPNNDGINDVLACYPSSGYEVIELSVYSRWGNQLFSTSTFPFEWNGETNGEDVQAGAYIVKYSYRDDIGNIFSDVSDFVLIR